MYPSSMASHAFIVAVLVLTSGAVSAQARQEQAPPPAVETVVYDPGAGAPAPVVAAEPYQLEMPTDDGPRFRFGFSLRASRPSTSSARGSSASTFVSACRSTT